ncbi:MAG: tetratricopeptide repeat protein [Treponema sp.]|nr:tetratricopeptide repeat protein [Treponema sp.]
MIIGSIFGISRARSGISNEKRELYRVWADADYERAYEITKNLLINKPVDYLFLTVNGFSAYQLGISQINYQSMLYYIDECIFSLRKALIQNSNDASVYYVLGKAYRQKGREYADLSVKFLEMADKLSYKAADIPEYLGLSYAEYGDYRSSVEAFSRVFAAGQKPSDNILLSIARSYMEMEEYNMAMSYLQNCIDNSEDSKAKVFARYMLAEIYRNTKDFEKAENQYSVILGVIGENAETRYQLGVLYSQQGDNTRARSQWREAFRLDPTHARARARL